MAAPQSDRRILLAIRGESLDERVLFCARNIARRVDACIEILLISPAGPLPKALEIFFEQLRRDGADYRLTHKNGGLVQEIVRYANDHEGILFVVIDSLEGWNDGAPNGDKNKDHWKKLACPLVIATACEQRE